MPVRTPPVGPACIHGPYGRELYDEIGDGDIEAGKRRIALWHSALPVVSLSRNVAIHDGHQWCRRSLALDTDLLLGHFRHQYALGGIHLATTQVLVIDLDRHGVRGQREWDLCVQLANRVLPNGIWFRSSFTDGRHLWAWLDEPIAIDELAILAAHRVRNIARQMPELLELQPGFRSFEPPGLDGVFELHPRASGPNSGGATLRAPLGRGSALITSDGQLVSRPASALERLEHHIDVHGLTSLRALFRGRVATQLALKPTPPTRVVDLPRSPSSPPPPAPLRRRRAKTRPDPYAGDLADLVVWLSAPHSEQLHADHHTYRVVMGRIRVEPPPRGLRHRTTFLLALSYRWDGLSLDAALQAGERWLRDVAIRTSREASTNFRSALSKTRSIIRRVYRADAPEPRRRHFRAPAPLRQRDIAALLELLPNTKGLLAFAVRILGFARANGTFDSERGELVCEMPSAAAGIRTRRDRRLLQLLENQGVIRRIHGCIIHHVGHDEWRSIPPLYAIQWSFADHGRSVSAFDFAILQSLPFENDRAGTVGVVASVLRENSPDAVRRDEVPSSIPETPPRPVGAVGNRRPFCGFPSEVGISASKLDLEAVAEISTERQRPQAPTTLIGPGDGGSAKRGGKGRHLAGVHTHVWKTPSGWAIGLSDGPSAVLTPDRRPMPHRRGLRFRIRHALGPDATDDDDG